MKRGDSSDVNVDSLAIKVKTLMTTGLSQNSYRELAGLKHQYEDYFLYYYRWSWVQLWENRFSRIAIGSIGEGQAKEGLGLSDIYETKFLSRLTDIYRAMRESCNNILGPVQEEGRLSGFYSLDENGFAIGEPVRRHFPYAIWRINALMGILAINSNADRAVGELVTLDFRIAPDMPFESLPVDVMGPVPWPRPRSD